MYGVFNGDGTLGIGLRNTFLADDDRDDDLVRAVVTMAVTEVSISNRLRHRYVQHVQRVGLSAEREVATIHRNSPPDARRFASWLLEEGSETSFKDLFRLTRGIFLDLCEWLRSNTRASDSRYQTLEQKVMVFLWILAYNEPQRNTGLRFGMSQSTVSSIFHDLKDPMRKVQITFVRQPRDGYLSPDVELNPRFQQFNGAIGAIDGTHFKAHIPLQNQQRFWSRKSEVSQNVLAAVSFDGIFLYVLAGAEGSLNDQRVLAEARHRSLKVPDNRYYLCDAGYGISNGIMIPYSGTYHLQDWRQGDRAPQDSYELFNLRHAQLRTIVEQVFGRCKRKWKVIRATAPEYSFADQIIMIYICTGLFNFIQLGGKPWIERVEEELTALTDEERQLLERAGERAENVVSSLPAWDLRDKVRSWMWEDYEEVL